MRELRLQFREERRLLTDDLNEYAECCLKYSEKIENYRSAANSMFEEAMVEYQDRPEVQKHLEATYGADAGLDQELATNLLQAMDDYIKEQWATMTK